jgi:DNA-binding MarR family transcriptional regulator
MAHLLPKGYTRFTAFSESCVAAIGGVLQPERLRFGVMAGQWSPGDPRRETRFIFTGDLSSPKEAGAIRDRELPPTARDEPTTLVLDLSGKLLSPAGLREFIVPLGQRVRGGLYGQVRLVITTPDEATRELIALLAEKYKLFLFLASSPDPRDVDHAQPVGALTAAETETLQWLMEAGGAVTAAQLGELSRLEPSAATNRLVNLERRGLVYRFRRPGERADTFTDPRHDSDAIAAAEWTFGKRDLVRDANGDSMRLQGVAAERAAKLVRQRRGG